jgi:hypothetical protein
MEYGCGEAVTKLRTARQQITQVAAKWQAEGVDTSPLTGPLLVLQEAIAILEVRADAEKFRSLARELRNHFNAVRVSGAGLETEDDPLNRLRWLDMIEASAERFLETLDRMEQVPSTGPSPGV